MKQSRRRQLVSGLCAVFVTMGVAPSVAASSTPGAAGTVPTDSGLAQPARVGELNLVVNERGLISYSIAGGGSYTDSSITLAVSKPSGATTRRAFLAVASTGGTIDPLTEPVTLDGQVVPLDLETPAATSSYNYFTDVTDLVKPKLDAAVTASVPFEIVEPRTRRVDGDVLIVVYDDPSVVTAQTVAILFGTSPQGGRGVVYELDLAEPVQVDDPDTQLDMSLGISFSCLLRSCGFDQFSTLKVNTSRLTTAAGGQDDGEAHNGGLITVGGEGDDIANPARPFAAPRDTRSDDELYDLRPFVSTGDTSIKLRVKADSSDNIFLATLALTPELAGVSSVD